MKEPIYDMDKIITLEETSRCGYNDVPMLDDIFIKETSTINTESPKQEKVINVSQSINDKEITWFYNIANDNGWNESGTTYAVDKNGNLITKFAVSSIDAKILDNDGFKLEYADKDKVLEAVKTSRKQINFLKQQKELQEEIKGYPEFNEKAFQLYEPDKTKIRFKNQKNLLRILIDPKNMPLFKLLLTLCSFERKETYDQLINDGIINLNSIQHFHFLARNTFDIISQFVQENEKLPSVKRVLELLELPYSQEFFAEYLLSENDLDLGIESLYRTKKKILCKQLSERMNNNLITPEEAMETLTQIDIMCTPINFSDSFNSLKENLEERKNEIVLSTGIKALDDNNALLKKGQISTVFAYTGSFKTMFCTNMAYNVIKNSGNVLYISLEISSYNMYLNFLSRHSYNFDKKISHSNVKANRLIKEDEEYLFKIIYPDFKDKLKSNLIIYDETDIKRNDYTGFDKLMSEADKKFTKETGKGIDLIIIDHINLFKFETSERNLNDYSAVNHWMSYFRKNCINFLGQKRQVSILCACQSSREGYKKALSEGRYQLTGIAEGNEIERSSQLVLSIFTDEIMRKNNEVVMQILKIRDESPNDSLIEVKLEPEYYAFGVDSKIKEKRNIENQKIDYSSYEKNVAELESDIEEE